MARGVVSRRASGAYEAFYRPTENGRHRALVTVTGSAGASIADPFGRLLHSENDVVDIDAGAPSFVRRVVVSFDVGNRPELEAAGPEQPWGAGNGRPRPTRLVSARRKRVVQ